MHIWEYEYMGMGCEYMGTEIHYVCLCIGLGSLPGRLL